MLDMVKTAVSMPARLPQYIILFSFLFVEVWLDRFSVPEVLLQGYTESACVPRTNRYLEVA